MTEAMRKAAIRLVLVGLLFAMGCDDAEKTTADTLQDAAQDQSTDTTGPVVDGTARTYRFTTLSLEEPEVSLQMVLNALFEVNIKAEPDAPTALHIILQQRKWDLSARPVTLEIAAGAGIANLGGAEVTYSFAPDAQLAYVPAEYRDVAGSMKIENDEATNLFFPVVVSGSTFSLPLRNILLSSCFANPAVRKGANCDGTDESTLFGSLVGGVIEAEANGIQVEMSDGSTLPLGDVLRDPTGACSVPADCSADRVCGSGGKCEREPDTEVDGQPAFVLAGKFVAKEITFVE
ncbi:MAG: hypothetical protein AUK47_04730 [Deltaproteobacteria bacterium CG2_30_63_29]|nr:MAG: hypothetical protein AUK47_04730 [Deltaproteobacteria bacterium CG2_30_63_29]PIV98450.1 MAG: hypothetical protein COW42_14600 [Deltaproteobacteria bacterium CG17_big_fil_post_rev_8_21_14_2_50_63_7]PJB48175.1 MAG: hypothetical protein CO108_02840 [Deltaproteobacteria bacterium CG_4_9_14_3_um_filter_63_12]